MRATNRMGKYSIFIHHKMAGCNWEGTSSKQNATFTIIVIKFPCEISHEHYARIEDVIFYTDDGSQELGPKRMYGLVKYW